MSPSAWFRSVGLCALVISLGAFASVWSDETKPKKYALLVGVTKYDSKNFSHLNYTVNDVEQMEKALKNAGFASVRLLTSKRGGKDAPTAENIRAALKELLAKKTREDTVLVGLAGHGMQLEVTDKDGKDPKSYSYFCPKDASLLDISHSTGRSDQLLLLDELFDLLGKCDAGYKLALIDACRNDGMAKATKRARLDVNKVTVPDGVGVLFSCGRGQFAFETDKLGDGHGVFFHYVIEGLKGEAVDKEGVVTWDSLAGYVKRNVPRYVKKNLDGGAKQIPASAGNQEGESILVPPTREKVVKDSPLDKDGKNSIGMEFKLIPKGTFTMGASKDDDKDAGDDEKPHKVTIDKAFYLGKHEVTQKQWKAVMKYNPSYFSTDGEGDGTKYEYSQPAGGKDKVKGKDTSDFPVENVSYLEAVKFCDKLNEKEKKTLSGWKYSLPSEAQWEYACRGGATSYKKYYFGDSISKEDANFDGNLGRTEKAGSYPANKFGLHDMHGNVWEWCLDWYDKDYKGADKDFKGSSRVSRGGSWGIIAWLCRSAFRIRVGPEVRGSDLGFRVALVPTK